MTPKRFGKISAQPHTTSCIQFLDREKNDKNNKLPLGKQICFTTVWGCAEILPKILLINVEGTIFMIAGHNNTNRNFCETRYKLIIVLF